YFCYSLPVDSVLRIVRVLTSNTTFTSMKYLFILLFVTGGFFTQAQNTAITESQFIEIEMGKIQKYLNSPALQMNNEQVSKLKTLFSQKYAKVYKSWHSGLTKSEMSSRRAEIEKEYTPLV